MKPGHIYTSDNSQNKREKPVIRTGDRVEALNPRPNVSLERKPATVTNAIPRVTNVKQ